MIRFSADKFEIMKIINFLLLLDLVFGGSGRLIMFGGISIRTVFFVVAIFTSVVYLLFYRIQLESVSFFLIVFFIAYLLVNVIAVGDQPISVKSDFLFRYLYVGLVLFYEVYFARFGNREYFEKLRAMFEWLTFLFAIFSILLWIVAFSLRGAAYHYIEMRFFRPYVYGSFDFISSGIPRIFMKSSIFVSIGLLFQLDRFIDMPTTRKLGKCIIYAIALVTTFTSGLFLATAICCILLLHKKHIWTRPIGVLIILFIIIVAVMILRSGLIEVMLNRYTGDYTTSYRLTQLLSIIREFLKKPLFGHGFGYKFTTVYGNTVRTTSGFEIAYGETLVDTGLLGFIPYIFIIGLTLRRLWKYSKHNKSLYLFGLGLLLICLESLTNPFINNSIGLTFFSVCTGMSNYYSKLYAGFRRVSLESCNLSLE